MNSISLVGRLTRDPELRERNGTEIAGMRLAVPRRPRGGEQQPPVYVDLTAFGQLATICGKHLQKGRRVAVSGRLEYSEWTDDNHAKHSKHEVIADQVDFLDPPANGQTATAEGESK